MKLPRGRFERFVRNVTIKDVLNELVEKKFSGCCSGIFGESQGELIFDRGEITLAESQDNSGSKVLFEIFSDPDYLVTAELLVYNESQIKLSAEFNPKFVINQEDFNLAVSSLCEEDLPKKQEPERKEKPPSNSPKTERKIRPASKSPKPGPAVSAGSIQDKNADGKKEKESEEFELSLNESDLESINKNFRENAREILKRIHLDHLIEKEKTGDKKK